MTVAQILAAKGRDVATIMAERPIADVVAELSQRKIGALLVMDRDRVAGIVSERNVVRAIGLRGAAVLDDAVSTIMTRDVVTCSEGDTINGVMTLMTRRRFRHLPVVESGRLAGIISIGDVVKARIEEVEREADELRIYIATA